MSRYTIPHTIHHTLLTSLEILVGTAGCNKSYLFTSGCLTADLMIEKRTIIYVSTMKKMKQMANNKNMAVKS